MPSYKIAHVKEQGIDLIIIPLESRFGNQSSADQNQECAAFQMRANSAGLAGTVVLVWPAGGGRMGFIAPPKWHRFFQSIDLARVMASLNKTLSW